MIIFQIELNSFYRVIFILLSTILTFNGEQYEN